MKPPTKEIPSKCVRCWRAALILLAIAVRNPQCLFKRITYRAAWFAGGPEVWGPFSELAKAMREGKSK